MFYSCILSISPPPPPPLLPAPSAAQNISPDQIKKKKNPQNNLGNYILFEKPSPRIAIQK